MLPLLKRVQIVLTGDTELVTLIGDARHIGVNLRKKPEAPAIEYGFDTGNISSGKKEEQNLRVTVYGTTPETGAAIAERVTTLLTPKNLTDSTLGLRCGLCRKNRNTVLPATDFGQNVEMSFRVLYTANPQSH